MTLRPALLCCCAALASGGLCHNTEAAGTITLVAEDYPPFSWVDKASGKTVGLSADIVAELMARAGVPAKPPIIAPWARAMVLARSIANACLYTTARVPEREDSYQWVGPIGRNEWVLFARRADHINLHSLDDAQSYQVGTTVGDASVTFLLEHNLKVNAVPKDRLNPTKLQKQRIQLWSVGRLPGLYLQRELGISNFDAVLTFAQIDMYLACHKAMDKNEIARLNDILRGMYRDGTVRRIYRHYGYEKETPHLESVPK